MTLLTPALPSAWLNGTSKRRTSPRKAAARLVRTCVAAYWSRPSNTDRPGGVAGGVTVAVRAEGFCSSTRPSGSSTTIASGTASMSERTLCSAAAVAASESISDRVCAATSRSSSAA